MGRHAVKSIYQSALSLKLMTPTHLLNIIWARAYPSQSDLQPPRNKIVRSTFILVHSFFLIFFLLFQLLFFFFLAFSYFSCLSLSLQFSFFTFFLFLFFTSLFLYFCILFSILFFFFYFSTLIHYILFLLSFSNQLLLLFTPSFTLLFFFFHFSHLYQTMSTPLFSFLLSFPFSLFLIIIFPLPFLFFLPGLLLVSSSILLNQLRLKYSMSVNC